MSGSFAGVFAALTTPFSGDGIAVEQLKKNIRGYNTTGLAGYVVLGSTGEAVFLDDGEEEKILVAAREETAPGKTIIAGASRESTKLTGELVRRLAGLGADAALVKPPHYYKAAMNQDVLRRYFLEVADASPVPILIYHIPQNTGVTISPETLLELSRHPRIAGIKDSSGRLTNLTDVIAGARPDFHFLIGAGALFLAGLLMGAKGAVLAMASVVPGLCVEVYSLFRRGKLDEARKLQVDLVPLNRALTETRGIPAIKYALDLLGSGGGPPRPPLRPLDEAGKEDIRQILDSLGLLKSPAGLPR